MKSMADFESNLLKLMKGRVNSLPLTNDSAEKADLDFKPVIKDNICYIVACVIISENDEVIMMQEAKQSCRGKWYLPAGRVEPNESFIDAAKREMKEETGLDFEPETLVFIEFQQSFWYRFTFTGRITGGDLKTPDQEDSESIQAKWCPIENIDTNPDIPLRSTDILLPIRKVKEYMSRGEKLVNGINVTFKTHNNLFMRLLICHQLPVLNMIKIVTSGNKTKHLPTTVASVRRPFSQPIGKLLSLIFKDLVSAYPKILGVVNLEHDGSSAEASRDGFCFTILVTVGHGFDILDLHKKFVWTDIENRELFNLLEKSLTPESPAICGIKLTF